MAVRSRIPNSPSPSLTIVPDSFHACRYPRIPSDYAEKFSPSENNHIVVLRKNRFFVVPLAHPVTGKELSAAELEL